MAPQAFGRIATVLLLTLLARPAVADSIWIEGESLATPPAGFKTGGWGNKQYLSGESWLFAAIDGKDAEAIPSEGISLRFPFDAKEVGSREVWARIGYEFARSPFRWRIDEGAWGTVTPDDLTTDLMCLADWNEIAWIQLGNADLKPGGHTLEFHFERRLLPGKKQPERILAGFDCFCLSSEPFRPNGPFRPGQDWKHEADRKAADHVFQLAAADGPRAVLPLKGQWEIARWDEQEVKDRSEPVKELPPDHDKMFWKAVAVPGNRDTARPDLLYCHRFLYRTRVHVPADLAGRSFVLRFPSTALLASVFVNGKFCGGSATPTVAWDADATNAVTPGKDNEIVVVVKDCYYALEKTGDEKPMRRMFNFPASWFYSGGGGGPTRFADFPVLLQVQGAGILETPTLTGTGPAYTADVFAIPSVSRKELGLEITLRNPTKQPINVKLFNDVMPLQGDQVEKSFAVQSLQIPAGGEQLVKLAEPWASPRYWWPDDPRQYRVVTRLVIDGHYVDEVATKFGFREWQWKGQQFTLNGIPWHFHADLMHNGKVPENEKQKVADDWRKSGVNTVRYWGQQPWVGDSQAETLDWYDAIGMPVRRSGIFDGEAASYTLVENKNGKTVARRGLFDNWVKYLRAWVKAERNHPSVFIWSIENEITFINIRNLGLHDSCEPEIRRAIREVMALDPTRPAMIDGGDALRDKSLPIYGNHYNEANFREYPDEAYTMKLAYSRSKDPWTPWPLGDDKPLFLGESFFAAGSPPAAYAAVIGEAAFLGRNQAEPGVRLFARMLAQGYRWHGLAGFHFWFAGDNPDNEHYKAFQPACVFCREWNWTFAGGQEVTRTLKVFNDTRSSEPIDVEWSFRLDGKGFAEGAETFALEPGTAKEFTVTFRTPKLPARTRGELVLTCQRNGQRLFHDAKPLAVLAPEPPLPRHGRSELTVFDPKHKVIPWLKARGHPFREAADLDHLPADLKVLLIGPDALTPREATDPHWVAIAATGARVLVLDQDNPLHFQATPADLTPTEHIGRIAFPENLEHPAFAGLAEPDFFCWSGDHVVYRHAYKKASRGARSLLQCDDELSCSALSECPVQSGVLMLCQAAVGSKLAADPVAQRLLDNLIAYCLSYRQPAKTTVTAFPAGDHRLKLLDSIGLKHTPAAYILAAVSDPKAEIVVADASPANLAKLTGVPGALKAFTDRGGYLMLWGLTPEGLANFNKLVGIDHVIRPFAMERVRLPAKRDPLLAGLTMRDVALDGTQQIHPWAGDRYPAKDTFTYVVDLDDIAPFATPTKDAHGWAQMTNGLTSADDWQFIFYHELKNDPRPKWSAEFPREEEVTEFSIVLNVHYQVISKMRLLFDDDQASAVMLELKGAPELKQDFTLKPRKCRKITLEPIEFDTRGKQPTTGVDNIWIKIRRSDDYHKRVVPLLNIGALVRYRVGTGGVILNQLRAEGSEPNPANGPKKANVAATLLRNLGATFAVERLLVAGSNLKYAPVPLNDKCTQFLTSDRGWIEGQPDLAHFPVGEQTFAGVEYLIRDFRTSPLPACIMLAGPGAKGQMPKSVEGIPVGKKADVLFFLHTFHPTREWRPRDEKERQNPPTLFTYVVHYSDGQTAEVPVKLTRGVGPWLMEQPQGVPEAAVAWAAPLPKNAKRQSVVYQMAWANTRPKEEIRSVDVRSGEPAGEWGVPVILAITAATQP